MEYIVFHAIHAWNLGVAASNRGKMGEAGKWFQLAFTVCELLPPEHEFRMKLIEQKQTALVAQVMSSVTPSSV